jgi:HPr kinase/phosphorylase
MAASTRSILGVDVPEVRIPVAVGRNLAVLVEVAVRNHILKLRGFDSVQEFTERHRAAIEANGQ